jgi:hypothetical protein
MKSGLDALSPNGKDRVRIKPVREMLVFYRAGITAYGFGGQGLKF